MEAYLVRHDDGAPIGARPLKVGQKRAGDDLGDSEKDDKKSSNSERESPEYVIKHFQLRRIIKENHGKPIHQLAFNRTSADTSNVVGTVGDIQANVYDNESIGENLDLMLHYDNATLADAVRPTGYKPTGSLQLVTCCWALCELPTPTESLFCVAGGDNLLHVLSVLENRAVCALPHTATVLDAHFHAKRFHLLTCSRDRIRIFCTRDRDNITEEHKFETVFSPLTLCFFPDGEGFFSGHSGGVIRRWTLAGQDEVNKPGKLHSTEVDCILFSGDTVVSKSTDGKLVVWDPTTAQVKAEGRVKGCDGSGSSRFDISADGKLLCAGNSKGTIIVFDLQSPRLEEVHRLTHPRSRSAVKGCQFSLDAKNILFVAADSMVWRWDYVDPVLKKEREDKEKAERVRKEKERAEMLANRAKLAEEEKEAEAGDAADD